MDGEEEVLPVGELSISIRFPSKREIILAIKRMKNGKATGPDKIPAEMLKVEPNSRDMEGGKIS